MRSKELTYTDETSAYLIAGRRLSGPFSDAGFDEFCGRIDLLAGELDAPLVVVPDGNFGGSGVAVSEAGWLSCALGLLIHRADTEHPASVPYQDLTTAVARAEALPWDRISALIVACGQDGPRQLSDDVVVHATASGPLAGVKVGYGVRVDLRPIEPDDEDWDDEDDDEDWDEDGPVFDETTGVAALVPGLSLIRGTLIDQTPQSDAVYGVQVGRAFYDEPKPIVLDFSEAAHAERLGRLGVLADQAAYHLIAHYD
ncbi:hypothetical protein [Amycolatopsis rhizosphaerae]|uniref:hypothetical protein n=1 Tax=Amycolatopsis rhizosphaerae TaxID=2053003 RepID=UPI001643AE36|nr:hypothetical protein [Amycolatopsis rhizosphaerae]